MKMILIWILMTLLTIQSKAQYYDTTYQSISYQKTLLKKGRFELYGWTSYDLYWADETGAGLIIYLYKQNKNGKVINKRTDNRYGSFYNIRTGILSRTIQRQSNKKGLEVSSK